MRLQLLIADHFDMLASGKVAALGLFADGVVVLTLPPDTAPPTAEMPYGLDLGLLLTLSDAELNNAQAQITILPPAGLPTVATVRADGVTAHPGQAANIMTKLKPLLVPCAGVYQAQVAVAGQVLTASFEVRIAAQPQAAALAEHTPLPVKAARARPDKPARK